MITTEEVWKDIEKYKGYYQISNKGNVRSLDRYVVANKHGGMKLLKGRDMKLIVNKAGYLVVNLRKEGKNDVCFVHRLVAECFLNQDDKNDTVNHIDGNKLNNDYTNLEWASYGENNVHALENELRKPRGVAVAQLGDNGNIINKFRSVTEASRITGISRGTISHCLNGRATSAGSYQWKYV